MKPRYILCLVLAGAILVFSESLALAWWQFVTRGPNEERMVFGYPTEKECQAALKKKEAELEKKYPNPERFPLTGSCEKIN
jgi:hypothetical protein